MNVCVVIFGGYLTKILRFKTGNLLNNSKIHLLSEGTVHASYVGPHFLCLHEKRKTKELVTALNYDVFRWIERIEAD